jgi:hydroxypyruvate reductase
VSRSLERAARSVFAATLEACDPARAFASRVRARPGALEVAGREVRLDGIDDVRVVAVGKASDRLVAAAAVALDEAGVAAGARRGIAVAHSPPLVAVPPWVERVVGGHPVPDASSFEAGRRLLAAVSGCSERSLVLFLLSGGGSALAEWPVDDRVDPARLAAINDALVRAALPIRSINAVRKRVSAIKGGRLAARAAPALQATLVVSDVAPGDWQSVASGPTVPDATTMEEAVAAATAAGLGKLDLVDTPRWTGPEPLVDVLLDCDAAAAAAARAARRFARTVVALGTVDGPLDEVVARHLEALAAAATAERGCVAAVVSAGEATLEVAGRGLGGRNTHTALAAIVRAREACSAARDLAVLSAGTDGRDGPTDAAGAVASLGALTSGPDPAGYLDAFDSYRYFEQTGGLVVTGPTGTNLRDVRVFLARAEARRNRAR